MWKGTKIMEKIFKPEKEQMIYHFLNLFLFSGKKTNTYNSKNNNNNRLPYYY
jgi:hypothetical protein